MGAQRTIAAEEAAQAMVEKARSTKTIGAIPGLFRAEVKGKTEHLQAKVHELETEMGEMIGEYTMDISELEDKLGQAQEEIQGLQGITEEYWGHYRAEKLENERLRKEIDDFVASM